MRNLCCALMMLVMLLAGVMAVSADEPYRSLTSKELKAMLDRQEAGLVVVDTRSPAEYAADHLPGAVNIPLSDLEKTPAVLIYPKDEKIVFYCNGFT